MEALGGGLSIIVMLFLLVLGVLWFCLPFAIFGTKDKLDHLISETINTNQLLVDLNTGKVIRLLSSNSTNPRLDPSGSKQIITSDLEQYTVGQSLQIPGLGMEGNWRINGYVGRGLGIEIQLIGGFGVADIDKNNFKLDPRLANKWIIPAIKPNTRSVLSSLIVFPDKKTALSHLNVIKEELGDPTAENYSGMANQKGYFPELPDTPVKLKDYTF
jgi:hypothetical protein